MNDELQVQAYHPVSDHCQEQRESLYFRQQFMTRHFSYVFRPDQLLPISNAPLVPAPGPGDIISLRRRPGGSQHSDNHADEFTRLNGNGFSAVDERYGQGEISKKTKKAKKAPADQGFPIPTSKGKDTNTLQHPAKAVYEREKKRRNRLRECAIVWPQGELVSVSRYGN